MLRSVGGKPMENIIYTFDFFDPWCARAGAYNTKHTLCRARGGTVVRACGM